MILLKDKVLCRCRHFYGSTEEWFSLIDNISSRSQKEVFVCDYHHMLKSYPKKVRVIRTIDGAKRTFFLKDSLVFMVQTDPITIKLVDRYLDNNVSGFYLFVPKDLILKKILCQSVYIRVRDEKKLWMYLK